MKKLKSSLLNYFGIFIAFGTIATIILSVILGLLIKPIFLLNESQLLYVFSSMAQIVGSVFGLTLTAYVFFVDKFKEAMRNDDTYYDATISLLRQFFHTLALIAMICGCTILVCIFGIITLHNCTTIYPILINESVLLFSLGIVSILLFGVILLDPEKLDREIKRQAESVREQEANDKPGDISDFLKHYNLMQKAIINLAKDIVDEQGAGPQFFKNYKPQIIQSLLILNQKEIINYSLMAEINDLRLFRNGLVHGVDFNVPQSICDRVTKISNAINDVYEFYHRDPKDTDALNNAIRKVYDLSKNNFTS